MCSIKTLTLLAVLKATSENFVGQMPNRVPPSGYRVRREYRTMTPVERNKFHNAMNTLYKVTIAVPKSIDLY